MTLRESSVRSASSSSSASVVDIDRVVSVRGTCECAPSVPLLASVPLLVLLMWTVFDVGVTLFVVTFSVCVCEREREWQRDSEGEERRGEERERGGKWVNFMVSCLNDLTVTT